MFLIHNSPEQAPLLAAAAIGACRLSSGWATPAQPELVAAALPDPEQRRELIELLVMLELLCRPIPLPLQRSLEHWAEALQVDDEVLVLARDLSRRSQAIATADFYRLNWIGEGDPQDDPHFQALLEHYGSVAYAITVEADPQELRRWSALADCPAGSLGRGLWEFYQQRGFRLPGELGGGNAALAHHDWVHLLTGYDTTPIGELEVTAFMAAASRSRGAMLGFLGAVSIYETGLLRSVVLGADYAQTLTAPGAVERVAAAIQRGAACRVDPLLAVDYFALADQPVALIRQQWGLES